MRAEASPKHHDIEQATVAFGPHYAASIAKAKERESSLSPQAEKLLSKDKEKPSLGELNPLIHRPDFNKNGVIDSIAEVTQGLIEKYSLAKPVSLGKFDVTACSDKAETKPRFMATFEMDRLTEKKIKLLEDLIRDRYSETARTRTSGVSGGDPFVPIPYPGIDGKPVLQREGWYFGPELGAIDGHGEGVYLYKDNMTKGRKFNDDTPVRPKFIVEIREASKYQVDLVEFVTQTASILAKGKMLDKGELVHEAYYDLMHLGLKDRESLAFYGLEEQHAIINRSLIYPLTNKKVSENLRQYPESVMLVGVPGTGKTLLAEQIIRERPDIFVLPFDPLDLVREMMMDKEKQTLMSRVAEIARITGKDIVFHIDDIENMVGEDEKTNSTMLNLMAGLKDSGFYLISSTNDPEKIPNNLRQPQRLGHPVHCPLQDENARLQILKIHSGSESTGKHPLFPSEEARESVLEDMAKKTDGYTPRYLAQIANVAKSYFLERIVREEKKPAGLTEVEMSKYRFSLEDWKNAFSFVSARCDAGEMKDRDRHLSGVVEMMNKAKAGFESGSRADLKEIFNQHTIELFNLKK